MFSSRTYVDVVKPDTMKGISWQKIQDTVKEHKGKVAPVVAPTSASGAEKPEGTAQAPASATGAMAAPIISNQAEFNAWFSSLNGGPAGAQKVVNMIVHSEANDPIDDQGGSLATTNALTLLLLSNGYHLNWEHFIKTDGAGTIRFQAHADDGVGWSNSRELHTELCVLLKEVWPRMQWEGDGDNPMAFTIVRNCRSASDAWLSSLNGAAAGSSQVVNMIANSEANTPGDDKAGSPATGADVQPSQPSQDQGGHDGGETDEDNVGERVRQAVAANQAENNVLLSTLRQRVAALEMPPPPAVQLNPFQTPGTVRLQPGGRGCGRGRLFDLNQTPSTHSSAATTAIGSPGASPLLAAYEDGNLSSCVHQVEQAFQPEQQPQLGALTGGGSNSDRDIWQAAKAAPSVSGGKASATPASGKKASKHDEFTAMEHLAKAQVSYLRTVNELREKVSKLEAYPILNLLKRTLSTMGASIIEQLSHVDKRTLTVIAMGLYIAWPRVAPTARASIKSALTALLNKLLFDSKM